MSRAVDAEPHGMEIRHENERLKTLMNVAALPMPLGHHN